MARRPGDPMYEMNDGRGPWQGAGKLLLALAVGVGLVLLVVYGGIPLSGMEGTNNRQARKLLKDAATLEAESLYNMAAEQYQRVADNPKLKRELRLQAAERLAVLQRDQLGDARAAETALEKAFHFAAGARREELRRQLEALRGRPVSAAATPPAGALPAPPAAEGAAGPLSDNEVMRVAGKPITIEDILFAWGRLNGQRPPTQAELEPFVKQYLDMALLAEEAARRGIDARGRTALDLKLNRLMTLNTALSQGLIEHLEPPSPEALKAFYERNPQAYAGPPILTVLPLVVRDEERARQVASALSAGEAFEAVTERYAVGGPGLKPGEPHTVNAADLGFKPLADNSGLPARLARLEEGQTTGPWVTARGLAFFKLLKKEGGTPPPFERARDAVLMAYQRNQLVVRRQELLNQLRQNVPIQFNAANVGAHGGTVPTTGSAVLRTTATQTTATAPAAPSPEP